MAEEAKTLLLELKFDTDEGLKRAADFRSAIDADKEALAELNKTIKKNGELSGEQLLQREKLEKSIRENTRARADELRAVDNYIKATKGAIDADGKYNGSIKNLRGSIGYLTEQWNGLSRAERENSQVGGVMQKEIKRLSDELKGLEGSVGDNRRSVGGYLDAIKAAPGAMGKFKAGLSGINGVASAGPLGLLTTALQIIPQLMNSSGKGADFFAKTLGMMNAIVQEGLKRLVALGGAAVKLFSGDFAGAFKDGKAALSDFSGSIGRAVKEGGALADAIDALEAKERAFGKASTETQRQIDKLLIQARNRTTSEADRIKLYEKAEQMELRLNQQAIALAEERIKIVKRQNDNEQSDEDAEEQRLFDAQNRKTELLRESENIREKIQVRKDALLDAASERDKQRTEKAAAEKVKRAEEAAAKELERLEDFNKKREIALAEATRFHNELAALDKKTADEKAEMEADLLAIDIENSRARAADAAKLAAFEKKLIEDRIATKEAEYKAISTLAAAAGEVMRVVASENAELVAFQKAITGVQIAINMAQAISKLTASSTEVAAAVALASGPAGVVTGPLAYAAYYATQIAAIAGGIAQAKQLLMEPTPKAPQFYEGGAYGYTGDGTPTSESTSLGTKPYTYHKQELIASDAALSTPLGAIAGDILMQIMGKQPRFAIDGYYNGGLYPAALKSPSVPGSNNVPGIDYNKLAKAVSSQPIYVIPTEIRDKANAADARKAKAGLGKQAA